MTHSSDRPSIHPITLIPKPFFGDIHSDLEPAVIQKQKVGTYSFCPVPQEGRETLEYYLIFKPGRILVKM